MEPSELIPVGCILHQWGSYRRTVRAWNHGTHPLPSRGRLHGQAVAWHPRNSSAYPPCNVLVCEPDMEPTESILASCCNLSGPDSHSVINWRVLNVGDMDSTLHDQMAGTTRA